MSISKNATAIGVLGTGGTALTAVTIASGYSSKQEGDVVPVADEQKKPIPKIVRAKANSEEITEWTSTTQGGDAANWILDWSGAGSGHDYCSVKVKFEKNGEFTKINELVGKTEKSADLKNLLAVLKTSEEATRKCSEFIGKVLEITKEEDGSWSIEGKEPTDEDKTVQ